MTKRRWKHWGGVLSVMCVTAGGMVFAAGTAYADVDLYLGNGNFSHAAWTENGDTLRVCDEKADGMGTRAYIYRPDYEESDTGTVLIKVSDPKSDGNCVAVSKDISENIEIALKVCAYRGDVVQPCVHYNYLR